MQQSQVLDASTKEILSRLQGKSRRVWGFHLPTVVSLLLTSGNVRCRRKYHCTHDQLSFELAQLTHLIFLGNLITIPIQRRQARSGVERLTTLIYYHGRKDVNYSKGNPDRREMLFLLSSSFLDSIIFRTLLLDRLFFK